MVVILHDINYAAAYADRVVAFKNGQVFMNDTVDENIEVSKHGMEISYEYII